MPPLAVHGLGALGGRERLLDGAVGHDHVDQQKQAEVELGAERQHAVDQLRTCVQKM